MIEITHKLTFAYPCPTIDVNVGLFDDRQIGHSHFQRGLFGAQARQQILGVNLSEICSSMLVTSLQRQMEMRTRECPSPRAVGKCLKNLHFVYSQTHQSLFRSILPFLEQIEK